jgi:hypothetical protein
MPRFLCLLVLVAALFAGCSPPAAKPANTDEERLQRVFTDFQKAFEVKKADSMWTLLDATTQAAAERAAEAQRTAYAKESPGDQAAREKKLGLPGVEIALLTGTTYLNAKPFRDKYHDVPEYKIAKFTVNGDKAALDLLAEDGDKDRFDLVRAGDTWKLVLAVPE